MDTLPPREVSVLEPIGTAFEKTKQILFQPFDLAKWFTIGFCAFLATLGQGGGFNFNFNTGGGGSGGGDFQQEMHNLKEGFLNNLHIIIPVAIIIFLFIVVISLVLQWLQSRGQFMFLHCVARNVAQVKYPWTRYASQANSLFVFKLILWLIGMVSSLIFIIPIILLLIPMFRSDFEYVIFAQFVPIIFLGMGLGFLGMIFGLVGTLTKDFVVPVMYLRGCTLVQGWRAFWQLCRENIVKFILFLLFLLVVNIAISAIVLMLIVVTCCCAACFLAIPYIGTVLLLPLLVWRRAYSALFFAQFGPEFDVFGQADPVVVPTGTIPPAPLTTNVPDLETNN